jgi:hypothetical protein
MPDDSIFCVYITLTDQARFDRAFSLGRLSATFDVRSDPRGRYVYSIAGQTKSAS